MAHYAEIDENGIVVNIFVGRDEDDLEEGILNWENHYKEFVLNNHKVRRTSYNTFGGKHYDPNTGNLSENQSKAFRKNYAQIGFYFDELLNAFIPPKPFDSWILNKETCLWESPYPKPSLDKEYFWEEESEAWIEIPD